MRQTEPSEPEAEDSCLPLRTQGVNREAAHAQKDLHITPQLRRKAHHITPNSNIITEPFLCRHALFERGGL